MAEIIKADGSKTPTAPSNGRNFQPDELQAIVGGHIELVYPRRGNHSHIMVINEGGNLEGLPVNHLATEIYHSWGGNPFDLLNGDVLLCRTEEVD